ncbi:MAG TPA: S1-like domain-containing RNA-binding protein [Opitutales bacterium]|nr:S1-like domain-containing RNA-binding protein [Opitutales bacterium]
MVLIGRHNELEVLRTSPHGFYLDGGSLGEILLPGKLVPSDAEVGDVLDVFLYRDSEDRLVATTETPYAQVGDFASLKVVGISPRIGIFLDWGLAKDVLLPMRELRTSRPKIGDRLVVHLFLDDQTDRIVASERLHRHLRPETPDLADDQPVKLLIAEKTPLGYKAIVDNAFEGLLYRSDLANPLKIGDRIDGYVRTVREDGKIDLSLDLAGHQRIATHTQIILKALEEAGGQLPFHDKSSPQEIRSTFGMSKKAFKQAIGVLFKKREIIISPDGIRLAKL